MDPSLMGKHWGFLLEYILGMRYIEVCSSLLVVKASWVQRCLQNHECTVMYVFRIA